MSEGNSTLMEAFRHHAWATRELLAFSAQLRPEQLSQPHPAPLAVESRRDADGRWPLENPHPGKVHFEMNEGEGKPSRWNTLRAMRVLRWYQRSTDDGSRANG